MPHAPFALPQPADRVVLLDERGRELSSEEMAQLLAQVRGGSSRVGEGSVGVGRGMLHRPHARKRAAAAAMRRRAWTRSQSRRHAALPDPAGRACRRQIRAGPR